jgi:dimethylhistidine N-methyltransferase
MRARTTADPAAAATLAPAEPADDFARDVRDSLSTRPRRLSPRHLYDPLGSALFDAICRLPWYRITRAEIGLLRRHAGEILAGRSEPAGTGMRAPATAVVELGPGNGEKLMALLEAAPAARPTAVHLIDISPTALADASYKLAALPDVEVTTDATRYVSGLQRLRADVASDADVRRLVLFLGSNIGNFEPPVADDLLAAVRAAVGPGDTLLLGTDLVKSERELILAYDDPLGVTAAFTRNVLLRLNRELGAAFDIDAFRHRATWNAAASRVEIHLVCQSRQAIRVPGAGLEFMMAAGETIWTESSYKYEPDGVRDLLRRAGFVPRAQWIDEDARFALTLAGAR